MSHLALVAMGLQLASGQFLVFGEGKHWLVLDDAGQLARAISGFPEGIPQEVREVAISPDGKRMAVTAWLPSAQNVMLFLWDLESGATSQIGDTVGFHAAPTFSRDGHRIVFAHHPKKGGPPGAHEAGSFAQLYEQNLETLELRALTTSRGCHMSSVERGGRLYFAHANCAGGRRIEVLEGGKERPLTDFEEHHGEPSLSLDGETLVFTRERGDDIEFQSLKVGNGARGARPQRLWAGPRKGVHFSPQFLKDGTVVFQNAETVFALIGGVPQAWWDLKGVRK